MMTTKTTCWLVLVALVLTFPVGHVRAENKLKLPPGVSYVTAVEGITEYRLTNGLTVLLFPDPSKPVITVNVTYKVGSRHEGYGETGMAHLLEHLVFKGTPRHPNIPQEMTARGARPNGTTSTDRTNYYETFDATEENLRWALDLESDRMINSFIARKDLESEFTVVRNEFESGENNPGSVLYKRMLHAVFHWHNYGNATIGEKSDIEGAPIERLQEFYQRYYQPDNAVLIVTGKFDEQRTLDLVQEYFGKIPRPARRLVPTYTREPVQDGEREVTLRRTGDLQVLGCMFRTAPAAHPDQAALALLVDVLTDEPTGRLYKALVEAKKATSVNGSNHGLTEGGIVSFWADVRLEQSITNAQAALLGVLDGLKTTPVTTEEVNKARTRLLKAHEMFFKQSERVGLGLSNYIGQGDWRLAFLYRDRLETATVADVNRVALAYLKPSNRTLGFFLPETAPERAVIPPAPDLDVALKDYKGRPPVAQGEDFDPSPANIEARTERGQLANGLRFALLPKRTRGQSVQASFTFRFGTLATLQNQQTIGALTAALLDRGTTTKTREQINESKDQLKARIQFRGGAEAVTVNIETDRAHLADTLRLAAEILQTPSFPAAEFERLRNEQLAAIEESKTDPRTLAQQAFARLMAPYPPADPRHTDSTEESVAGLKAATLDEVKAFHSRFYGGTHGTGAVVGDFDPAEIKAVLATVLGKWSNRDPYERLERPALPVATTAQVIETPDKANAVLIAGLGYPMRNDDPDYPALTVAGHVIGGGFLNSRLATRIRQQEGLSYSVGGQFFADARDQNGGFRASAIYNPQNVAKLEQAFREEIERAARDGLTEQELTDGRAGWLKARKLQRANDSSLASVLNAYLDLGRTLAWDAAFENQVEKLTLAGTNAALKKYLDFSKMILVKAGNFRQPAPATKK